MTCNGCSSDQQKLEINISRMQAMLPSAEYQFMEEDNGNIYIEASYENDSHFQEEVILLLESTSDQYAEYFLYGSRGNDINSYKNRYNNAFLSWSDESNTLLQFEICRNAEQKALLKIKFLPQKLLILDGKVNSIEEFTFSINTLTNNTHYNIYWDYHGNYMYPQTINGLENGKTVKLYYLDETSSFSNVNGNKCCHIKGMKIIN